MCGHAEECYEILGSDKARLDLRVALLDELADVVVEKQQERQRSAVPRIVRGSGGNGGTGNRGNGSNGGTNGSGGHDLRGPRKNSNSNPNQNPNRGARRSGSSGSRSNA